MRLRRGVKHPFQQERLVSILDRISNSLFYHFRKTHIELLDLIKHSKNSTITGRESLHLIISDAFLSGELGKSFFGEPRKLNQYADHDHFLALALLGRSCRVNNQRQAIIHYARALLLTINEVRCAGLSNKQVMRFKQEGIDFLAKWANKPTPYKDKREQEYALLAKWALSLLEDPSIQKMMLENPSMNTTQVLALASNNNFYHQCTLEERAIVRQHLEKGFNNAFGHSMISLSKEREQQLLKYQHVIDNQVHLPKQVSYNQKIIAESLKMRASEEKVIKVENLEEIHAPLSIKQQAKAQIPQASLPKSRVISHSIFQMPAELDDQPGARPEDKISKRESIALQPGLFKSEEELVKQVQALPVPTRSLEKAVKENSNRSSMLVV